MKTLGLVSLLFITGCASRPKPSVAVRPLPSPIAVSSVRYAEIIRAYYVGRYVGANDVMHEQHPIYRVEGRAQWNLKPGSALEINRLNPQPNSAYTPAPTNDVILAELSRQKDATERVMQEAVQLARSYEELQRVIKEMTAVARNHASMNARLADAERHVTDLQQELERLSPPTSATNEVGSVANPDQP